MIKISKANIKDKEEINLFFSSLSNKSHYYFNRTGQNKKYINKYISGYEDFFIPFLLRKNGEIAGILILYNLNRKYIKLSIGIGEKFQGTGLGTLLMAYAEKYARKRKKGGILLTTHISNKKAQALYLKAGYKKIAIQKGEYIYRLAL